MALIVELLDTQIHARNDFYNENPNIDKFLKERANREHEQNISDTYVLINDNDRKKILGFFTLSLSSVILSKIPLTLTKKISKYPKYGTVLLGRMGRDHRHTPKGFGSIIIKEAMKESLKRGTFYALEVNAKKSEGDKLIKYYMGFGFVPLLDDKNHLIMSRDEIVKATTENAFR